ncbi:MAG: metallophosphoesterase, partial [bacterium]
MRFLPIRSLAIGLLLAVGFLSACTSTAKDLFKGVDRIVAVGDLHGDYDQYIKVLTMNGLVDEQLRWQGGKTHFVQLGDVVDRGPDSIRIIRHLMKLEKQARKKGGRVHVLIGNHEVMNIQGDLRYVHPGEYSALIAENSDAVRARYIEAVYKHRVSIDPTLATNPDLVMAGLK